MKTAEEIAEEISGLPTIDYMYWRTAVSTVIQGVRAEMREECAQVTERLSDPFKLPISLGQSFSTAATAAALAQAIRSIEIK